MAKHPAKAKKSSKPGKAPDSFFARQICAYLLIAFGVLVFLSVILQMQGVIFDALRTFAFGMAGSFGFLIPLFPVWAGVSLLFLSRKKGSARVSLLICLFYLLLLAAAILFTYTSYGALGRVSLMDYFAYRATQYGAFTDMISHAFSFCASGKMGLSGGLIGTLIAWPLWRILGSDIAGVLCILGMIATVLAIFRVDLIALFQNLRLQALELHNSRSEERVKRQEAIAKKALEVKKEDMIREARRQAFTEQPQPSQFSGPQKVVPGTAQLTNGNVSGFAPTPEENPDYKARPRSRRSAFSRIFGESEKQAEREIASEVFQPTAPQNSQAVQTPVDPSSQPQPAVPASFSPAPAQPYSPEQAWQQNGTASPFQMPKPAPTTAPAKPQTESLNPHGLTGANKPAAAYKNPPEKIPTILDPDLESSIPVELQAPAQPTPPRTATGQRMPSAWISETGTEPNQINAVEPAQQDMPQASSAVTDDRNAVSPAEDDEFVDDLGDLDILHDLDDLEDSEMPDDFLSSPSSRQPAKRVVVPRTVSTPSTWTPELTIQDPGRQQTFGQQQLGIEPDEDDEDEPIPYIFPDPSLLKEPDPNTGFSPEEDAARSQRLEETLASFKIACTVKHVTHGPTISRFELELAAGIKVSKITDLGPNIAMNMEVKSVRIEAPIPGKSLVGVEVPNTKVATVTLKEVLSSEKMVKATEPLVVALGKDIAGVPVICNLARMPHLLIAGATGSGKSVCINTIIGSLLYRTTPDQVRLILVDPKVVELQCYNGIPHLLAPVVSDPHKAAGALQWAVDEMMRRYTMFQEAGVRNLDGYNKQLGEDEKHIPRIVIIIDELADLMMTCKREVEEYICRLAQLARAAGIHLIVATQRPSVDVITGLIKANIPSRIAFKVSSFIDSRTILDKNGAEQLLGYGDMLYQPMGEFTPIRVQGCFLSDEEVNSITDFIRQTSQSDYDENFVSQLSKIETESAVPADVLDGSGDHGGDSSLLDQCIEIALLDGQVSTSLLQRRLKIGYARAGRLVDEMEKQGIISAKDGAKPRLCLITRDEYETMKSAGRFA